MRPDSVILKSIYSVVYWMFDDDSDDDDEDDDDNDDDDNDGRRY
jgi:hypothetical protein